MSAKFNDDIFDDENFMECPENHFPDGRLPEDLETCVTSCRPEEDHGVPFDILEAYLATSDDPNTQELYAFEEWLESRSR